jgi:dTDP-glucose 4,6-dehydratase
LELHGGGYSTRAFIHINDVVRATLQLALEGEPGTTWHLSSRESCSIRQLVEQIFTLAGSSFSDLVKITDERLGKDQSYLLSSSAMREVHGWSDEISLQEGLRETLAWVDANLETLKTLPWSYQHKL